MFLQFLDDGLLLVRGGPASKELVQRGVVFPDGFLRVVGQRFGDQFAIGAVVLDPLGDHLHFDIVDVILDSLSGEWRIGDDAAARPIIYCVAFTIRLFVVSRVWVIVGRNGRVIWPWFVDLDRVTVEVLVSEQLCRLPEVHDGEVELVVVFVDSCATADDLLELGHGLDASVQDDQLAGLRIHTRRHQPAGGHDDGTDALRVNEVV